MLNIGCHLSTSKGFADAGQTAVLIGANTFQCFSRNPRGSSAKKIVEGDVEKLNLIARENGFSKILFHAPYTLNPCSADPRVREFALQVFTEDIAKLNKFFPGNLYVFHPGSHGGQGVDRGLELTVEILNQVFSESQNTIVLLETMSGKGTEIGKSFEEIQKIIDGVQYKEKIGVCIDTCHIFAAGYDIKDRLDDVFEKFDRTIGLEKIYAVHLNDSKNPLASHKDGHACLGDGYIGLEALVNFVSSKNLRNVPFFLETPGGLEGFAREISLIRAKYLENL